MATVPISTNLGLAEFHHTLWPSNVASLAGKSPFSMEVFLWEHVLRQFAGFSIATFKMTPEGVNNNRNLYMKKILKGKFTYNGYYD